jgi:hypothetical protein
MPVAELQVMALGLLKLAAGPTPFARPSLPLPATAVITPEARVTLDSLCDIVSTTYPNVPVESRATSMGPDSPVTSVVTTPALVITRRALLRKSHTNTLPEPVGLTRRPQG